jgi:ornithine cyclodeaminase/alanine dehydrogenase-like protein (mu-crystallin family)
MPAGVREEAWGIGRGIDWSVREISGRDVRRLVSMDEAIVAVREAFVLTSQGRCDLPVRTGLRDASLLVMLASVEGRSGTAVKLVSINQENRRVGLPTIQAVVLWFEGATGSSQFILDGNTVTALRTGAASGVATDLLATKDASVLAMIGAGAQAMDQVLAVTAVRPIEEVRVVSRSAASAEALCGQLAGSLGPRVRVRPVADADQAVSGSDVVCCATPSTTPLFQSTSIKDDAHVNAIGAFRRSMCELPGDLLRRASVIAIDQREAALEEAGDLLQAIDGGDITEESLVEIGTLVAAGTRERKAAPTIFKSVGIAAQDWAIADLVRARIGVDTSTARLGEV